MRLITTTCEPREDVKAGGLDDRDFAAQLEKVVEDDDDYATYTKADRFFALTYPTSGLKDLMAATFGHLTGSGGSAILRAQTSFGGGKTHSLIALYHLAQGFRPDNLHEFVDDAGILPEGPIRVAAVVGDTLDPVTGSTTSGQAAYTLWGEIAAQLGPEAWAAVAEHDAARAAPGTGAIRKMLAGGPAIIVLDELAQHLHMCAKAGRPEIRDQAEQIAPFLKNLSEEVDGREDVVVVVTLATSTDAYSSATDQLESVFTDIGAVLARKGRDIQPASETEIAEILKRRLFNSIDASAAAEAAEAFSGYYDQVGDQVGITSKEASQTVERLAATYPFHPELVNVLDKRIGTIPKFQRTRGALRLLSRVIAEAWKTDEPPVILNVADLPLSSEPVVQELTVRIDRHKYQQVIQADVVGAAAHAGRVDHDRYQDRPVATRAATTVLAHSLEETTEAGSPLAEIALGTLRPGDDASLLDDALQRLYERAWHLTYDNVRWKFQTAPNANRIVASEADRIQPSRVHDERYVLLRRMCRPTATIAAAVYPEDLDGIPDEQKLQLAVPHHDTTKVTAKTASPAPGVLQEARARTPSGKPRRNRNGIAYLVADTDKVEDMDRAVRRMLAAQRIVDNDAQMQTYADAVQSDLRKIADTSLLDAHIAVGRCYRHLYYPAANAGSGDLVHVELPANVQGTIGDRVPKTGSLPDGRAWTDQVWATLQSNEKVRPPDKALGTDWLRRKAWKKDADRVRTTEVLDVFWTDHTADLLTDTSPVVKGIQQGVTNGSWVLQDMRDATDDRGKVFSNRSGTTPPQVAFDDSVWLIDYDAAIAEGLLAIPTSASDVARQVEDIPYEGVSASDLRQRIEHAKSGHEPSKREMRDALAEAVRQKRVTVYRDDQQVTAGDLTGDKVGFDELVVRKYVAEDSGDYDPKIVKSKRFEDAAALAVEKLSGWATELIDAGHTDGLLEVALTIEVDEEAPNGPSNLITMLGSIPDIPDVAFSTRIEYGIDGVDGEMDINIDRADRRQAQQKVKPLLTALAGKSAAPIAGDATVDFVLDQPYTPSAPKVKSLFDTITTYFTGAVRITGKVA